MNKNPLIDPMKIKELLLQDYVFIDLRTKEDFEHYHLPKFQNIPYDQFTTKPILTKEKPTIFICYHGSLSNELSSHYQELGYPTYSIAGGILATLTPSDDSYY